MNRLRPPKKSETLEVRLPHAVKQAFMARARTQGRTASAVLREFVDSYLAGASPPEARPMIKRYLKPAAATTAAASALALYALTPSAVAAAPDLKSVFAELDRDRDGAISSAEFIDRHDSGVVLMHRDGQAAPSEEGRPFMLPLHPGAPTPIAGADLPAMLRHGYDKQDSDRNGAVTFGEFESHHLAMYRQAFDEMDLDENGTIERPEYERAVRRAPGWPAPAILPFENADDDRDGRISWEEFFG